MISRRRAISAVSLFALALCTSCGSAKDAGDDCGKSGDSSLGAARKHISADSVIDVFLFSLDGRSISEIGEEDLQETIRVLLYVILLRNKSAGQQGENFVKIKYLP